MSTVITIDGPAACGKGSVAKQLATMFNFHYLESGLIYRAVALLILQYFIDHKIKLDKIRKISTIITNSSDSLSNLLPSINNNIDNIMRLIRNTQFNIIDNKILINNINISWLVKGETMGLIASFYSKIPEIRQELIELQRSFEHPPGLIADGRDMGSVIFPKANLKIFLTADLETRALRAYNRYQHLAHTSQNFSYDDILKKIKTRDHQDSNRKHARLSYDDSYLFIDNSHLSLQETVDLIKIELEQSCLV